MNKHRLKSYIDWLHNANSLEDVKYIVCEFMQMMLEEAEPPLDWNRPVYVKDDVDLKELCYYFQEFDDKFINTSVLDEYIVVMKDTREIVQCGYSGTVYSWWEDGKLRQ